MTRRVLERAIAQATGESLSCIRNRGFSLVIPPRRSLKNRQLRSPQDKDSEPPCLASKLGSPQ